MQFRLSRYPSFRRYAAVLALTACLSAPAFPQSKTSYLPLSAGSRWEYSAKDSTVTYISVGDESQTIPIERSGKVVGTMEVDKQAKYKGQTVCLQRLSTHFDPGKNMDAPEDAVQEFRFASLPEGMRMLALRTVGSTYLPAKGWETFTPPILVLKANPKSGDEWNAGTMPFLSTGRMSAVAQVEGFETVEVPAGKFENCLKVVRTSTKVTGKVVIQNLGLNIEKGTSVVTSWYAPGVGTVKQIERLRLELVPSDLPGYAGSVRSDETITIELRPGYVVK